MFSNSLTPAIAEFPTNNFIFVISYFRKNSLNRMSLFFLFSSLFSEISQLNSKVSKGEKSMY